MKGLTIGFRVRIKICNHNLENTETSKIIKLMWHIMTSHHHVKMVLNEPQIFGYFPPNGIISIYWYFIHPLVLYLFIGAMWVLLIISGAHNYSIMPKSHRYKITYVSPRVSNYRFSGPRNLLNISLGLFQKVAYTEVSKHSLPGPQYPVQDIPQTPAQFSKRGYKEKRS